jgi:hypothetical protein
MTSLCVIFCYPRVDSLVVQMKCFKLLQYHISHGTSWYCCVVGSANTSELGPNIERLLRTIRPTDSFYHITGGTTLSTWTLLVWTGNGCRIDESTAGKQITNLSLSDTNLEECISDVVITTSMIYNRYQSRTILRVPIFILEPHESIFPHPLDTNIDLHRLVLLRTRSHRSWQKKTLAVTVDGCTDNSDIVFLPDIGVMHSMIG